MKQPEQYFLGIDNGGTVSKAALYDSAGKEIALCAQKAQTIIPQPGFVERDLSELLQSVNNCVRGVITKAAIEPRHIAGVSTSCHGKGLYLLGADGQAAHNGIISSDTRAQELVQELTRERSGISGQIYDISFQQLWSGHPAMILKWFARHRPEILDQTHHILMGHDYIRYHLSGEIGAEISNISGSALVDVRGRKYSDEILRILGLEQIKEKLAPIVGSTEFCGRVTRKAAEETGLMEGTPVYGGFFDVVAAAISSGLVDKREINATMGTWCIATCLSAQIIEADYPYIWGNYCLDDTYFAHEGSPTSASNLDWLMAKFVKGESLSACNQAVQATKRDEQLLFLPFLYASNLPVPIHAAFLGLQAHHERGDLLRALYEGVLFAHKTHLERLYPIVPQAEQITLVGGPGKSAVWMQLCADIMGRRIVIPNCEEAGCKGVALAAMVGAGQYRDFQEAVSATVAPLKSFEPASSAAADGFYQDKYRYYQDVCSALSDTETRRRLHSH